MLALPRLGCVNQPRLAAAALARRRAGTTRLAAGDEASGVTINGNGCRPDTGAILAMRERPITSADTGGSLLDRLAALGPPLLLATLDALASGNLRPQPQDNSQATYAAKIGKREAAIDGPTPARCAPSRRGSAGRSGSAPDIAILWARPVPDDFHARFDALSRSYLYRILDRPVRPALERARACWMRRPLDADAMHLAAQLLVGEHDFSALRSSDCQSPTPIRKLLEISVTRYDDVVEIAVRANEVPALTWCATSPAR